MNRVNNPEVARLLKIIWESLDQDQDLFIVGGAVRDMLLSRPLHDLDFVMPVNPTTLARSVARKLQAGFFVLDDDRHTARVVYQSAEVGLFPLDFVRFTGDSLEDDLAKRDFTINAMAIPIRDMERIIDPYNGREDLAAGRLRACGPDVLMDDPVRVLRGIRQSLQFELSIEIQTADWMKNAAAGLPRTSFERQRDELFKILEGPNPAEGMDLCQKFRVYESLIPELVDQKSVPVSPPHVYPLWKHTTQTLSAFKAILNLLSDQSLSVSVPWWLAEAGTVLGSYSERIRTYFRSRITPERSRLGLALLGALLHDIGKPVTMKLGDDDRLHYYNHDSIGAAIAYDTAKRLQLSNAEAEWVRTFVRYHMRLLPLVNADGSPTSRAIYRFFRKTGEVGVAVALFSLADSFATYGDSLEKTEWAKVLQVTQMMLTAWWQEQDQVVAPRLLLDGHDLQEIFDLSPGKTIGRLLAELSEAQAAGEVESKEEAIAFIQKLLSTSIGQEADNER
jgi:putative nucleotidyltransferase with HDIG domain